ncbi:GNAT family N-acetyltransferase [Maribacter cobaltidurans]|uniref:GNAT family N-acetyltransferase n=1 Tax=Maribacter cobaltidurans TaxID=1178778 RepID=A0A223V964_9FLAO|nr:GNAT family N-acetyltransferase [Maribacter cobaltidurans]ASV31945.1 GNAT family N-acetyltransferase [Maribacter cobaltidurans]GGD85930.1 putative N-acetyltransferase YhfO [Maribacter cobaltidurans]
MVITQATITNLKEIVPLFDQYRVFYGQSTNLIQAEAFLKERFENKESIILVASMENQMIGFTQLYFSFSSVYLEPTLILNDLFVLPKYRGQGIGTLLLKSAQDFCEKYNYKGLSLETAIDNPAQKLYEKLGWEKDSHCFHYFWSAQ